MGQNLPGVAHRLGGEYKIAAEEQDIISQGDYLHLIRRLPSALRVLFYNVDDVTPRRRCRLPSVPLFPRPTHTNHVSFLFFFFIYIYRKRSLK